MPGGFDDAVRPYQLPESSDATAAVSQYNLAANTPIYVTPGQNGQAPLSTPPIQMGSGSMSLTVTFYMPQSAVEQVQAEQ